MTIKKDGTRAATQERAESLKTQGELMTELNRLQAAISDVFREVDRYYAHMCDIGRKRPLPETDLQRRVEAARSMLDALNGNRNAHYLFLASTFCGLIQGKGAGECERLVLQSGVFFWFFYDEKGKWYIRQKNNTWLRSKWQRVAAQLKLIGIGSRKDTRGLSDLDLVQLYFSGNPIELSPELEAALLAGEKMTKLDIIARSSHDFILTAGVMDTMRREFGDMKGRMF